MKPPKPVKSFKHKDAKRAHIPSAEEAGYEAGSLKVQEAGSAELPLNPIITRGQDPELFSLNELFGNAIGHEELDKVSAYYTHADGWTNRLIQGDSLLVARELLHESGSCLVQISDENIHLVRNLMDEVFGSENFMSLIPFAKTAGAGSKALGAEFDYLIWYAKQKEDAQKKRVVKYWQLYLPKASNTFKSYKYAVAPGGKSVRPATAEEKVDPTKLPEGWRLAQLSFAVSQDPGKPEERYYTFQGVPYDCGEHRHWKTKNPIGLDRVAAADRLIGLGKQLNYIRYFDDFPATALSNDWSDTGSAGYSNTDPKVYVVQTDSLIIQRCILMTTDPGDLVLDPTCGSGTTAYVAEKWGRRWITSDTSRIALNIAKTRLMTATFPYYQLYDQQNCDLRQGFNYKNISHIKLEHIANNEPPEEETVYDQPLEDKKRLRVAGPFTVETLQSYEPISPEELARQWTEDQELGKFEDLIFAHLKSAGVKTGVKDEFEAWRKGLSDLAKTATRRKAEQTLKIQIDDEAFSLVYGHQSHPFPVKPGQRLAVRVISQFGEETTKVLEVH